VKKRIICLLVLALFIFSNTAFATNWVFAYELLNIGDKTYIDSDSAIKFDGKLVFWELSIKKEPEFDIVKAMRKIEATLKQPREYQPVEVYYYYTDGREEKSSGRLWGGDVPAGSYIDKAINVALKYAKEGKDTGVKPKP